MPFPFPAQEIPVPASSSFIDQFSWEMVSAHNMIMRNLNRTYEVAPLVDEQDVPLFLEFAALGAEVLHHHHDVEERNVFPTLAKLQPAETERNKQQHLDLFVGLNAWIAYIDACKDGKEIYDGEKFTKLMEAFGDVLYEHLVEEIPTITPEALGRYPKEDIEAIETGMKKSIEEIKGSAIWTTLPFCLFNSDMSVVPRFPPFPAPLIFMVRHVFSLRYSARWKFCLYDKWGYKRTYKGV